MDKIDIKHLEDLSKLKIDESERAGFEKDFQKIVEFVDEITKLDISYEEKEPVKLSSLREAEVTKNEEIDPLLDAPKKADGCFVTPLVVE